MSGPIPMRSDQRVRRNAPDVPIEKITAIGVVVTPELEIDNAHPIVVDLYRSMSTSAQSKFYEDSDWQVARLAMLVLNDYLNETDANGKRYPISAMKLSSINQMLTSLLLTEGDRRRVRIEVERNTQASAQVVDIATLFEQRLKSATQT